MPIFSVSSVDIGDGELRWWVKVVGMLQQNWALPISDDSSTTVLFVDDAGGVFDRLSFADEPSMVDALRLNGFEDFSSSERLQEFLHPPALPLSERAHPNGPIYSSGRFWRT